jgi:hypothetical protein
MALTFNNISYGETVTDTWIWTIDMATLRAGIASDIVNDKVFYDTEKGYAESIDYAAGTGFDGIWQESYQQLDADGYVQASSTAPACWCRTSDAPAIGQTIARGAQDYIIVDHQPNDDGETLLILREG